MTCWRSAPKTVRAARGTCTCGCDRSCHARGRRRKATTTWCPIHGVPTASRSRRGGARPCLRPPGNAGEAAGGPPPLAQADIDAVYDHAAELAEAGRGTQAAEALAEILPRVADADQARELRGVRGAALFLAGDFRRALPEFDGLATAYARLSGAQDERALECRRQAAYCRMELGDLTEALAEMRGVLLGYRDRGQERDPEILELRRTIARLQIATGRSGQAADALPALYSDIREVLGPNDPLAAEVGEMLERFGSPRR